MPGSTHPLPSFPPSPVIPTLSRHSRPPSPVIPAPERESAPNNLPPTPNKPEHPRPPRTTHPLPSFPPPSGNQPRTTSRQPRTNPNIPDHPEPPTLSRHSRPPSPVIPAPERESAPSNLLPNPNKPEQTRTTTTTQNQPDQIGQSPPPTPNTPNKPEQTRTRRVPHRTGRGIHTTSTGGAATGMPCAREWGLGSSVRWNDESRRLNDGKRGQPAQLEDRCGRPLRRS